MSLRVLTLNIGSLLEPDWDRRRHEIVLRFLISLGLDPVTAERDAEGIEHHVSARTLAVFSAFANRS